MVMLFSIVSQSVMAACNRAIMFSRPDSRYHDNNDGTVTDMVTRLMWMQCPEGVASDKTRCDSGKTISFSWQQALQRASEVNSSTVGNNLGYTDWRVPTLLELKSLAEMACFNPAINTRYFPNTPALYFWSSTPVVSHEDKAWGVGFYYGGDRWGAKSDVRYVRLVRNTR
jgi:hypothetical protein